MKPHVPKVREPSLNVKLAAMTTDELILRAYVIRNHIPFRQALSLNHRELYRLADAFYLVETNGGSVIELAAAEIRKVIAL